MRYREAVRAALPPPGFESAGTAVLVCAPGEQQAAANALLDTDPRWRLVPLTAVRDAEPGAWLVAASLPREATEALRGFNERREWLGRRGVRVVLALDAREHQAFDRDAPDTASVVQFTAHLELEPDLTADLAAARAELADWNRHRWGRLDLRGLIRAEGEDVSWPLATVYQDLEWVPNELKPRYVSDRGIPLSALTRGTLQVAAEDREATAALVLGPPGSGKTFFLRSLATRGTTEGPRGILRPAVVLLPLSALGVPASGAELFAGVQTWLLENGCRFGHLVGAQADLGQVTFLFDGLDEVGTVEARRRVMTALDELARRFPRCPVIATSRIAGHGDAPSRTLFPVVLLGLGDPAIRSFLLAWFTQYAQDRRGDTDQARAEGQDHGTRLAEEVLAHPHLRALARNPLMLTILAVVHRAGVQLPNHRAELYLHASRVLIERWNQVRSLAPGQASRSPLRTADAIRILGPVSLDVVRSGGRASISEGRLRAAITAALKDGKLRGVGTAEEVLALFHGSLGLLVESGPGSWSFLHLTLAEYFAALELIRTRGLEEIAADPVRAFLAEWREVLVLAAGELGVNRAEDGRVDTLVRTLVRSAAKRPGRPSAVVPSVLGGLLADDPNLSTSTAAALIGALVPTWWFERAYGARAIRAVLQEASTLIVGQIDGGAHGEAFRGAVQRAYGQGKVARLVRNLGAGSAASAGHLLRALITAGVDPGRIVEAALQDAAAATKVQAVRWIPGSWRRLPDGQGEVDLVVSRTLEDAVRAGQADFEMAVRLVVAGTRTPERGGRFRRTLWSGTVPIGSDGSGTPGVRLIVGPLSPEFGDQGPASAAIRPVPPRLTPPGERK